MRAPVWLIALGVLAPRALLAQSPSQPANAPTPARPALLAPQPAAVAPTPTAGAPTPTAAVPAPVPPSTKPAEEPPLESRLVLRYGQLELRPDIKLYLDYQASLTNRDANAFHVTRGYLGLKVKLLSWLSGRVTFDISQAADLGKSGGATVGADGKAQVDGSQLNGSFVARLKYAYLDVGLPFLSAKISFGMIHTPYIYWVEHIEGGRFLRKTMIEQEYGYPSADLGIALLGNIGDVVDYAFGLYNGGGYAAIENARFKDVIGRVSVRPTPRVRGLEGLQLSGYFQVEIPTPSTGNTHRRFGGALTYRLARAILSPDCRLVRGDRLAVWLQLFGSQDGAVDNLATTFALSAGARVELPWRLALFGRFDRFDANRDAPDKLLMRALTALMVRLHEGVTLAAAYQGAWPGVGANEHLLGLHAELGL
jgi:hypothetical protein